MDRFLTICFLHSGGGMHLPDLAGANKRPQPPASCSSFRPPGAKSACTPPLLVFFSKTKNIFGFYSSIRIQARKNGGKRPHRRCATGHATSRHLSHSWALTICARCGLPSWGKIGLHAAPPGVIFQNQKYICTLVLNGNPCAQKAGKTAARIMC